MNNWFGPLKIADDTLDALRCSVAKTLGADPHTWPNHKNAHVAIVAAVGMLKDEINRLTEERDAMRDQVGAWIKANAPGGWIDTMRAELAQHRAARIAYASEFDGDVDSIHENIRNLKKERDALAVKVPDEIERLRAELKDRETFIEGYREQSVEDVALYTEKLRTAELERDALRAELDAFRNNYTLALGAIDALRAELDALKAWKEEVEKQEPIAWMKDQWCPDCGNYWELCREDEMGWRERKDWVPLYALPIPAQSVPYNCPTEEMTKAFAEVFNVLDQQRTFPIAFRAALAAAPKPEGAA